MQRNEDAAAQELRRREEAREAQVREAQRLQAQRQQQQETYSAQQRSLQAYESARQAQQAAAQARSVAAARTRGQVAAGVFGAVMGALAGGSTDDDDDEPPTPAYRPSQVYRAAEPVKQVVRSAMPGGSEGVAAKVQESSLDLLRAAHSQIDQQLQSFKSDADKIVDVPNPWVSSGAAVQPSTYLPVNTGNAIPAANPWAETSAANETTTVALAAGTPDTARLAIAPSAEANPWASPSAQSTDAAATAAPAANKCRATAYKFQWRDGALRCYANSPREKATRAATCCE